MHGHYHIHLRVWELAVAPSAINHVALWDHLLLGIIFRKPHKAKTFRAARPALSFNLEFRTGKLHLRPPIQILRHTGANKLIPEPWWLLQMCWSSLWDPALLSSKEDPARSGRMFSCPLASFLRRRTHQFPPSSFCCLNRKQTFNFQCQWRICCHCGCKCDYKLLTTGAKMDYQVALKHHMK